MAKSDLVSVRLRSQKGEEVTRIEIPKLFLAPGVILWCDRVFVRKSRGNYWEIDAYVVPTPSPVN